MGFWWGFYKGRNKKGINSHSNDTKVVLELVLTLL
jgi:hypothetical protein